MSTTTPSSGRRVDSRDSHSALSDWTNSGLRTFRPPLMLMAYPTALRTTFGSGMAYGTFTAGGTRHSSNSIVCLTSTRMARLGSATRDGSWDASTVLTPMATHRSWISGHFGEPAPWPGVTSADVSAGGLDDTVAARTLSKRATTRVGVVDRHLGDVITRRSTPTPRNADAVSDAAVVWAAVAIALTDADIGGEAKDDASRRALSCGDGDRTTVHCGTRGSHLILGAYRQMVRLAVKFKYRYLT